MNNIAKRLRIANQPAHLGGAVIIDPDLIEEAASEIERLEAECGMLAAGLCIHPEALNAVDDKTNLGCQLGSPRHNVSRIG